MTQTTDEQVSNNANAEDTEITLGTGKMLALFFGLVILCAIFFGMGYGMGRNAVKSAPELLPSPSTSSTHPVASKPSGTPAPPSQEVVQQQSVPLSNNGSGAVANTPGNPTPSAPTASTPDTGFFVQVAAVTKQEDAEALVESLKGRQYAAVIASSAADKLFHVQVGPFANIQDAEATRAKLVSDGYSPIVKK